MQKFLTLLLALKLDPQANKPRRFFQKIALKHENNNIHAFFENNAKCFHFEKKTKNRGEMRASLNLFYNKGIITPAIFSKRNNYGEKYFVKVKTTEKLFFPIFNSLFCA